MSMRLLLCNLGIRTTICLCLGSIVTNVAAEEVRYFEKDGLTYRESRHVYQRPQVKTDWEQREQTVYREKLTTEYRPSEQTVYVPVTEYRWESRWAGRWNPLVQPYLAYRMVPFTRWERRTQTVQIPITQREMIPEKRLAQVPVTRQVVEEQEVITRVAVGPAARKPFTSGGDPFSSAPSSLASRPTTIGGVKQLNGDLSGPGTVRR